MIRLIAFDMDGTLLNASSDLTPRTQRALQRVMDAGAMISLSSGRMTESMLPIARQIGVNAPMILYNGALIYDHRDGRTLYSRAIPGELAISIARTVEELGLYLQVYPGEGFYCAERTGYTKMYEESCRVHCQTLGQPISAWLKGSAVKLLAIGPAPKVDEARALLTERFPKGASFFKSRDTFLEMVAEGVDKGQALFALADAVGVSMDEVMAFGDEQNDAPMLRAAGCGVAMGNAVELCKAAAQVIAPKNTEDGVAQVLEAYLDEGRIGGR